MDADPASNGGATARVPNSGGSTASDAPFSTPVATPAPEGKTGILCGARAQQLAQRVVHLEADLELLHQRKAQLEHENEVLAAAVAEKRDLEARLQEALVMGARLEAECRKHRAEDARRVELEEQQAQVYRSFTELQGVVSQLAKRLTEVNAQRMRLSEEKGAAEAAAAALRVELQKWRRIQATTTEGHGLSHAGHTAVGRATNTVRGRSYSWGCCSCGGRRRGCHTCRLRCRADFTHPLMGTSPGRGLGTHQRGSCQPQQPHSGTGNSGNAETMLELTEAKIECELLRQQIASEERACAEARQGRTTMHQE